MKNLIEKQLYIRQNHLTEELFSTDAIFFDIETTGFSPNTSVIYLIGCMYREGEQLVVQQFFAENKQEEQEILSTFMTLLSGFHTIISFNGVGFDIPFIKAKCDQYHISQNLINYQYIDIFKLVGQMKFLLKQPNYKQKTIERFLGIHREDTFTGGELIQVYDEYLSHPTCEGEEFLLLHNREDVTGMMDLLPILSYHKILNGSYRIQSAEISTYTNFDQTTGKELIITLENDYIIPKRVSFQQGSLYFTINKENTKVRVPLFEGELKYFYPNYKEYYYLPVEDMAIHKSVANFVDKQYRERAKACNCYTRKAGIFVPQYDVIMNPTFKTELKSKITYFQLTDDFISSDVMLRRYVDHVFEYAVNKKRK